jgi:hypothetical protein
VSKVGVGVFCGRCIVSGDVGWVGGGMLGMAVFNVTSL